MPTISDAKPGRRLSTTFHWRFQSPAEKIWPLLADTERFNEAAKLPRYRVEETPRADGGVDSRAEAEIGPLRLRWREAPTNWIANEWFRIHRDFENGPMRALTATLRLFPDGDGCRGEYQLDVVPRIAFGAGLWVKRFFASTRADFDKLTREADAFACGATEVEFDTPAPTLEPGGREKLSASARRVGDALGRSDLATALAAFIAERPEIDARKIRPLELARRWRVAQRDAVELCLQAVRDEMLGMRWDLLCPRCQVAKAAAASLDQLPDAAHCPSCNIEFGRDYSRNVELAFFPSRAIRPVDDREFCASGPRTTPHVVAQITAPAGATRRIALGLAQGGYRLRTLEAGGAVEIDWRGGAFPDLVATQVDGVTDVHAAPASAPGGVALRNDTPHPRTFVIEELGWRRDALTMERATTLQKFDDLFSDQILRPGDHLEIDHLAFLFVDLTGSTALYQDAGDAEAFALVREFFAVVGAAIREQEGVLVKTVGDAVHAAFASPRRALDCALAIQRQLAGRAAEASRTVAAKIGLHAGRSIAVTLNGRLDYYGSAVNKAARLADQAAADEIVLSEEIAVDPGVAPALEGAALRPDSRALKGFAAPVDFYRLAIGSSDQNDAAA